MVTLGAVRILAKHGGNRLSLAEALLLGKIDQYDLFLVEELVSPLILEAARIRLTALGRLTSKHMKKVKADDVD